ncbi:aldose 1-epimerase family protein [Metabacillus sp. GX 13764]|uniref:aldose 1-epimerase family protein n=1 Tax=Metabacillus kandeliae TaxID=2900151 RepID=UPI001E5AC243|nr:aldose 1-epimerase family protein [Metabacillus kandeliae]MCD7033622.1 aldose 1-epimerase family protein [Metabacillus kandeliae]
MLTVIENEWLQVKIAAKGAEVREVKHKKTGLDYMWTGDSAYWGRVSPVLFPIVGRLKDDQYKLDGSTYEMPQHGFLRDQDFILDKRSNTEAAFVLESAGKFKQIYPQKFKAVIHYELSGASLTVKWEILNDDKGDMFFSIGAHPAFRVPLLHDEHVSDYRVDFTSKKNHMVTEYELQDSLIREKGQTSELPSFLLDGSLFKNDALVYSHIDAVSLTSAKSGHGVKVLMENFPFVGIWSRYMEDKGTIAPFVCIEPWYGIADTIEATGNLNEKLGIQKLGEGEKFRTHYQINFI